MFTGIIEEIGRIEGVFRRGNVTQLCVAASRTMDGTKTGDSISVNGACLTVVKKERAALSFEVMQETLKLTNLGLLRPGDKVNLERSLKVGERLSGHFVSGHIDCMGLVRSRRVKDGNLCLEVALPVKSMEHIVPKGSVALDGVSLTVVDKNPGVFSVYIIPHTLANTILQEKGPSYNVNVEFDILAKYAKSCR